MAFRPESVTAGSWVLRHIDCISARACDHKCKGSRQFGAKHHDCDDQDNRERNNHKDNEAALDQQVNAKDDADEERSKDKPEDSDGQQSPWPGGLFQRP